MADPHMPTCQDRTEEEALMPNNMANNELHDEDHDRGIIVNASDMPEGVPMAKKKKKKRKNKPASKRGIGKPTGFEEFNADAPLTPEQYAESKGVFDPAIPFVDRVLRAIQRFERTKRMSSERRDVFYKYLAYGGVDVGPNMFVGAQDTEDMDKDQINTATAQANISDQAKRAILDPKNVDNDPNTIAGGEGSKLGSPEHLAKYVVDFEGTMRAFLSRHVPMRFTLDTIDFVKLITTTLERFMDYLLLHEVCPEYQVEVLKTRNICRMAETQLWHCAESQRRLPGDFNIACSTLFGGSFKNNYDGETDLGPSDDTTDNAFIGLSPEKATQLIGFAIAGAASEDVYLRYLSVATSESANQDFEVVNVLQNHGFEITKIEPPTQECLSLYRENTSEFRPVGKVYAKFFRNHDALPEDLTPEEQLAHGMQGLNATGRKEDDGFVRPEYIFFVEQTPQLELLHVGMRVEATIHELNCGVFFFSEVVRVFPSFDMWIENELMLGWKEPKPVAGAPDLPFNIGGIEEAVINHADTHSPSGVDYLETVDKNGVLNGATNQPDRLDAIMTGNIAPDDDDEAPY